MNVQHAYLQGGESVIDCAPVSEQHLEVVISVMFGPWRSHDLDHKSMNVEIMLASCTRKEGKKKARRDWAFTIQIEKTKNCANFFKSSLQKMGINMDRCRDSNMFYETISEINMEPRGLAQITSQRFLQ